MRRAVRAGRSFWRSVAHVRVRPPPRQSLPRLPLSQAPSSHGAQPRARRAPQMSPRPRTGQSVMKICASQWKEAKAAGTTGGESWPQFLAQCRASRSAATSPSGSFAPAPAPAPGPASQSGSLFPWWQPAAPASTPAPNVGAPSALQAGQYTTELAARARCPSDTVVWVNTPTRIYHYSGTRYYGQTHRGAYMCEADARAAGYRAARNRQREAGAHSG